MSVETLYTCLEYRQSSSSLTLSNPNRPPLQKRVEMKRTTLKIAGVPAVFRKGKKGEKGVVEMLEPTKEVEASIGRRMSLTYGEKLIIAKISEQGNKIEDKIDSSKDEIIGKVEQLEQLIKKGTSATMKAIFETTEVKTEEDKRSLVEKELYLYLVDEFTRKPVVTAEDDEIYPIKIQTASDTVNKYLPMTRMGLQAVSVVNGAAALANMFWQFVPSKIVPQRLTNKAKGLVDGLTKESNVEEYGAVQADVKSGDAGGKAKRGNDSRDFKKFLKEFDSKSSFAGLMRVCSEDGSAIWVSKENAENIKLEAVLNVERKVRRKEK